MARTVTPTTHAARRARTCRYVRRLASWGWISLISFRPARNPGLSACPPLNAHPLRPRRRPATVAPQVAPFIACARCRMGPGTCPTTTWTVPWSPSRDAAMVRRMSPCGEDCALSGRCWPRSGGDRRERHARAMRGWPRRLWAGTPRALRRRRETPVGQVHPLADRFCRPGQRMEPVRLGRPRQYEDRTVRELDVDDPLRGPVLEYEAARSAEGHRRDRRARTPELLAIGVPADRVGSCAIAVAEHAVHPWCDRLDRGGNS